MIYLIIETGTDTRSDDKRGNSAGYLNTSR
jgi:hypothetical protein